MSHICGSHSSIRLIWPVTDITKQCFRPFKRLSECVIPILLHCVKLLPVKYIIFFQFINLFCGMKGLICVSCKMHAICSLVCPVMVWISYHGVMPFKQVLCVFGYFFCFETDVGLKTYPGF
jgi:hypothetical protein